MKEETKKKLEAVMESRVNKAKEDLSVKKEEEFVQEVRSLSTEFDLMTKQAIAMYEKKLDALAGVVEGLQDHIQKMRDIFYLLNKLPEKMLEKQREAFEEMGERVTKVIKDGLFKDMNESMKLFNEDLERLHGKLISVKRDVEKFEGDSFKRRLLRNIGYVVLMVVISSLTSYIVVSRFPQRISISHEGNLQIQDSKVDVRKSSRGKSRLK